MIARLSNIWLCVMVDFAICYLIDFSVKWLMSITLFYQRNLIREATAFLLDVLKPNLPEHGYLQTKVRTQLLPSYLYIIKLSDLFFASISVLTQTKIRRFWK